MAQKTVCRCCLYRSTRHLCRIDNGKVAAAFERLCVSVCVGCMSFNGILADGFKNRLRMTCAIAFLVHFVVYPCISDDVPMLRRSCDKRVDTCVTLRIDLLHFFSSLHTHGSGTSGNRVDIGLQHLPTTLACNEGFGNRCGAELSVLFTGSLYRQSPPPTCTLIVWSWVWKESHIRVSARHCSAFEKVYICRICGDNENKQSWMTGNVVTPYVVLVVVVLQPSNRG